MRCSLLAHAFVARFPPLWKRPVRSESAAQSAELERKIFSAVEQASKSMFPANLAVGRGSLNSAITASSRSRTDAHALLIGIPKRSVRTCRPEFTQLRVDDAADARAR